MFEAVQEGVYANEWLITTTSYPYLKTKNEWIEDCQTSQAQFASLSTFSLSVHCSPSLQLLFPNACYQSEDCRV
jgi:hypothetical protein